MYRMVFNASPIRREVTYSDSDELTLYEYHLACRLIDWYYPDGYAKLYMCDSEPHELISTYNLTE